jgi:cob(I)alamin adenosyltransferase
MRTGVVLLLAAVAFALCVSAALAADTDKGRQRPPLALSEESKSIWMGEWVACTHKRLGALAKEIGVKVTSGRAVQVVARLIARKAETPLWNISEELETAIDGCRNGILWRYYHGI